MSAQAHIQSVDVILHALEHHPEALARSGQRGGREFESPLLHHHYQGLTEATRKSFLTLNPSRKHFGKHFSGGFHLFALRHNKTLPKP